MSRERTLSVAEEAGLALRCAADAFALLRRRQSWPFVALVIAGELAVVAMFAAYPQGILGDAIQPLLRSLSGEAGSNYPGAYAAFPRALATIGPWCGLFLTWPGLVLLLDALPRILRGNGSRAIASGMSRWPAALLAALPASMLAGTVPAVHDRVGALVVGMPGLAATLAVDAAGLLIAAALGHAVPAAVLGRKDPLKALATSVSMAGRFPRLTAAVFFGEGLALAVFRLTPSAVEALFERIPPESVLFFLGVGAVVSAFAQMFRIAMFGRLFLHVYGETAT